MIFQIKKRINCCFVYAFSLFMIVNVTKITPYTRSALVSWYEMILPSQFVTIVLLNFLKFYQSTNTQKNIKSTILRLICCGYLLGFPSGAILVSNAFKTGKISKKTATLLMPVCNIFGPAYLFGFVYPTYQKSFETCFLLKDFLIAVYGLPLIYLTLVFILSNKAFMPSNTSTMPFQGVIMPSSSPFMMDYGKNAIKKVPDSFKNNETMRNIPGQRAFQNIISDSLITVSRLAGYMMLFSSFQFIGDFLPLSRFHLAIFKSCFEITTALQLLGAQFPVISVFFIIFGCFSGIAQTSCILSEFEFPVFPYILQKFLLGILGVCYLYYVAH